MARKTKLEVPYSKYKENIANLLKREGYLDKIVFEDILPQKTMKIDLTFKNKKPVLRDIKLISRPGLRVYRQAQDITRLSRKSTGILVISTSKGLKTAKEAIKENLGGEVIAEIR